MMVSPVLEVKFDNVEIGDTNVLHSIAFECAPGTITFLVGENGSGKSILLKSIAGVQRGVFGQVQANGQLYKYAGEMLRSGDGLWPDLTMVLQSYALWPTMNIGDQIRFSPSIRGNPITSEQFDALVEAFSLENFIDRRPSALSGGERQRSALAKAFALQPKVMLLDEPSSSLDVRQTQRLIEYLKRFTAGGGTVLLASHSTGLIRKLANQCVFLAERTVAACGKLDELTSGQHPKFDEFWSIMAG